MADYRYDHLDVADFIDDMRLGRAASEPGAMLPAFDLPTTSGGRLTDRDLRGRPALIVFGSRTCPMTIAALPQLKRLFRSYGAKVRFLFLYVREAHPGEHIGQPATMDEKLENARRLQREERIPWIVAVDTLAGDLHRKLDDKPNSLYLVDARGRIAFRALWASDSAVESAVAVLAEGRAPSRQRSGALIGPVIDGLGVMHRVLRRAGPRAERDLWRVAPPIALLARLSALFGWLPPRWRAPAALGFSAALAGALLAALRR